MCWIRSEGRIWSFVGLTPDLRESQCFFDVITKLSAVGCGSGALVGTKGVGSHASGGVALRSRRRCCADRHPERVQARHRRRLAGTGLDWEHDFFGALTLAFVEWDDYFASHPEDRAMTAAVNLEGDEDARVAVRHAVNPYYLSVLRPLLEFGQSSGQIRADTSLENATAMLLLLLPLLALAPHVKGLDPVLKLDHKSREERLIAFEDLSDMFRRAYGTAE